jgi:hypothetical protein
LPIYQKIDGKAVALPSVLEVEAHEAAQLFVVVKTFTIDACPFRHKISFKTNDRQHPEGTIQITGAIQFGIVSLPRVLNVAKVSPGQAVHGSFRVVDGRPLARRGKFEVCSSSSRLRIDSPQLCEDRQGLPDGDHDVYRVRVELNAPLSPGEFKEEYRIVDNEGNVLSDGSVFGFAKPPVVLSPSVIVMDPDSRHGQGKRSGRCICESEDGELSVKVVSCPSWISARVTSTALIKRKIVEVECVGESVPKERTGKIHLQASRNGGPAEALDLTVLAADYRSD